MRRRSSRSRTAALARAPKSSSGLDSEVAIVKRGSPPPRSARWAEVIRASS